MTPTVGSDARSILALVLKVHKLGLPVLNAAARLAADQSDTRTRRMIEDILVDEEAHLNWLKHEAALLKRLGVQLFLRIIADRRRSGALTEGWRISSRTWVVAENLAILAWWVLNRCGALAVIPLKGLLPGLG